MGTEGGYTAQQQPPTAYGGSGGTASSQPPRAQMRSAPPQVTFSFFALSTLDPVNVTRLVTDSMRLVQVIWHPRLGDDTYESTKDFEVKSAWNGQFRTVDNRSGEFNRIDFPRDGAAVKALQLVKQNFENSDFAAIVPVFICNAAWDEREEPGSPRNGPTKGFTLVRSLPWFTGERAIFLFASMADSKVLAHELIHWCGVRRPVFQDDVANIGGGGFDIDREQLRRYYRWATEYTLRKTMAGR